LGLGVRLVFVLEMAFDEGLRGMMVRFQWSVWLYAWHSGLGQIEKRLGWATVWPVANLHEMIKPITP
jgi:hypothetical protein